MQLKSKTLCRIDKVSDKKRFFLFTYSNMCLKKNEHAENKILLHKYYKDDL